MQTQHTSTAQPDLERQAIVVAQPPLPTPSAPPLNNQGPPQLAVGQTEPFVNHGGFAKGAASLPSLDCSPLTDARGASMHGCAGEKLWQQVRRQWTTGQPRANRARCGLPAVSTACFAMYALKLLNWSCLLYTQVWKLEAAALGQRRPVSFRTSTA
jgi:hypothetical protein